MTIDSLFMTIPDKHEFEQLLQQHQKIVYKVVNTYCWHNDERADLAQEIAIQLWRAFPTYDVQRNFSTWMYRIALNVAISIVRQKKNSLQYSVPLDESHHNIGADIAESTEQERIYCLQRFIAQLDTLNRALMLLYLEDHSYREIAEIVGISETNVATKISRLKQRIREDINTQS